MIYHCETWNFFESELKKANLKKTQSHCLKFTIHLSNDCFELKQYKGNETNSMIKYGNLLKNLIFLKFNLK